ncbi:unnamed protein product [Didymodactylos carnosus]|uniref:Fork-head domain-containing protein n=1 Tax=Didymodactylos carnosus TaxID=1234261 RepID=A0A8S2KFZ9_9BILA|nr:unnamed protein product [Didymodactylos carnosus]CAF3840095.1 unnamed protein product [Didymodactylos carnosus]
MNDCYSIDLLDKMVKQDGGDDEIYPTKQQLKLLQESHSSSSRSSSICSSSTGLSPTTSIKFHPNPILSETTIEQQQQSLTTLPSSSIIIDPDLAQHIEYELGLTKKNGNGSGGTRKNAWGNLSYAELITKAINSSQDQRLTLSEIYDWMIKYVPFFRNKVDRNSSAGWKNSIRHNLSLHNRFKRVQSEGTGKSSWWIINPDEKNSNSTSVTKQTRRRLQQQHSSPTTNNSNNKMSRTTVQPRRTRHARTTKMMNDSKSNSVNTTTSIERTSSTYDNSNTHSSLSLPLPSLQNGSGHLLPPYDTSNYDQQWPQSHTDALDTTSLYDHSNTTDLYHPYDAFDDGTRYHNEAHYQQQQPSYNQSPFCPSMYHPNYHQHHHQTAYYQQEQTPLTVSVDNYTPSYNLQSNETTDDQHNNYLSRAHSSSSHSSSSLSPPQLNNTLNSTVYPTTVATSSSSSRTHSLSRKSSLNSLIQPPQHYENYLPNHVYHKPGYHQSNTDGGGLIFNGHHHHHHDIETLLHLNSVDDDNLSPNTVTINERFYTGGQQQPQQQSNSILRTVLKRTHPFVVFQLVNDLKGGWYRKEKCQTLLMS